MQEKIKIIPEEKKNLHPNNPHRFRYNFEQLIASCKELSPFVFLNKYNTLSIDFANPTAVKMLNKAMLSCFYNVHYWDIPKGYLCPPIPGRADYVYYVADLLALGNGGVIPKGHHIKVLDIGVGANCVYPIIGTQAFGWQFIGSDIDVLAIKNVNKIIEENAVLKNKITCRLQADSNLIFKNIVLPNEFIDVVMCNPPFHASLQEAKMGTQRKLKNLGGKNLTKTTLNFGGQNAELYCHGGELGFINKMISESVAIGNQCLWFTCLISKSDNLAAVYKMLNENKALQVHTINMAQGQKISRFVAWTFQSLAQQKNGSRMNGNN